MAYRWLYSFDGLKTAYYQQGNTCILPRPANAIIIKMENIFIR
jgi:hypothetical protein